MTRVMVISRSEYPVTDKGLASVIGMMVEFRTAGGVVAAKVVAARGEPDGHTYRLTLDVPPGKAPWQQREPVCPLCGGPAARVTTERGPALQCRGPCV